MTKMKWSTEPQSGFCYRSTRHGAVGLLAVAADDVKAARFLRPLLLPTFWHVAGGGRARPSARRTRSMLASRIRIPSVRGHGQAEMNERVVENGVAVSRNESIRNNYSLSTLEFNLVPF